MSKSSPCFTSSFNSAALLHKRNSRCRVSRAPAASNSTGIRMVTALPTKKKVVTRETKTVSKTAKPKMYRLFIINDPFNSKARVVEVLLKVVQGLTFSRAQAAMEEAHNNGKGLVMVLHQELAEHYCSTIMSAGIFSTVEPDN